MARGNIYKALLGKLEKQLGFLPEGTKLPPEQELAEKFGVSKPTLRRTRFSQATTPKPSVSTTSSTPCSTISARTWK